MMLMVTQSPETSMSDLGGNFFNGKYLLLQAEHFLGGLYVRDTHRLCQCSHPSFPKYQTFPRNLFSLFSLLFL